MTGQRCRNRDPGRVGILASTNHHARVLAQDFKIQHPVCFSPRSLNQLRDQHFNVLLVHEDSWPVPPEVMAEIAPSLHRHKAYAYRLCRHDLHRPAPRPALVGSR